MEEKITLDRESFKALAADTRINLLKSLGERRKTLSELSKQHNLKPSTVKEHLDMLQNAELISQKDEGYKWKYWELTRKGRNVVFPSETNVMIILGFSSIVFVGAVFLMMAGVGVSDMPIVAGNSGQAVYGNDIYPAPMTAPETVAGADTGADADTSAKGEREPVKTYAPAEGEELSDTQPQIDAWEAPLPEGEAEAPIAFPFVELAAAIISAIVMGLCIGYLAKRRARI